MDELLHFAFFLNFYVTMKLFTKQKAQNIKVYCYIDLYFIDQLYSKLCVGPNYTFTLVLDCVNKKPTSDTHT